MSGAAEVRCSFTRRGRLTRMEGVWNTPSAIRASSHVSTCSLCSALVAEDDEKAHEQWHRGLG